MRSGTASLQIRLLAVCAPLFWGVLAAPLGCGKSGSAHEHAHDADKTASKGHVGPGVHREKHGPDGHDGGAASDLRRPVEELFAMQCEHDIKTFTCADCRHEVGVVRAPEGLVRDGLFAVVRPATRTVGHPVELTGEVKFDERRVAHISPAAEGVVRTVHVMVGDEVKKGKPLVEIESVRAGDAHAELLEARARLDLAERTFERAEKLRAQGIASEKDYLEVKLELEAAKIRANSADGRLHRLGGTGSGTIVLRAPVDGSVLLLHAVPGEFATSDGPLATVGNNKAVWVWADLYEQDIARVIDARSNEKLAASVFVKAYPGKGFPGVVDFVSPAMERSSRTVKLRIQVDNESGRLLAGMFAHVLVFLPGDEKALSLPQDAVLEDEGESFVFVHYREDYYVRRRVEVGREWGGWVEIRSGITENQNIVSRGAFLMKSDVLRSKMGAGCAD